jgi:hypothetical protein
MQPIYTLRRIWLFYALNRIPQILLEVLQFSCGFDSHRPLHSIPLDCLGHLGIRDLLIAAGGTCRFLSAASKPDDHTGASKKQVLTPFSTNKEGFPVDAHGGAGDI